MAQQQRGNRHEGASEYVDAPPGDTTVVGVILTAAASAGSTSDSYRTTSRAPAQPADRPVAEGVSTSAPGAPTQSNVPRGRHSTAPHAPSVRFDGGVGPVRIAGSDRTQCMPAAHETHRPHGGSRTPDYTAAIRAVICHRSLNAPSNLLHALVDNLDATSPERPTRLSALPVEPSCGSGSDSRGLPPRTHVGPFTTPPGDENGAAGRTSSGDLPIPTRRAAQDVPGHVFHLHGRATTPFRGQRECPFREQVSHIRTALAQNAPITWRSNADRIAGRLTRHLLIPSHVATERP